MNHPKTRRTLHVAVGFSCLAAAGQLLAETPATNTPAAGDALDEVVVTATRRVENLQVVPLTVDVVSPAMLAAQNLTSSADLKRLVPDLNYRHSGTPGNDAFNIRGVETLGTSYGLEQSAGTAFDGVPLARPVGSIADLVDIHSVEVLEGPQGMLFGKNASAGLINIVSNTPEIGKTDGTVRVAYGTLNLQQYSGTLNLATTEDSALRLTGWNYRHNGDVHELNTDQYMNNQNSGGIRLKYRWTPTENLDLNATGEWVSHDQNGTGYTIRSFNPANFNLNNDAAQVQQYELAKGTVPGEHNLNADGLVNPYYDRGHTNAYTGQADYRVGQGTITGIASYRGIGNADSFDPFPSNNPYNQQFRNTDFIKYDQWSEELRYASPIADRFRFVAGVFNFHLNLHDDTGFGVSAAIPGVGLIPIIDADSKTDLKNNNYAGFGEATFDITKDLHVFAGLRRSTDQVYEKVNNGGPNDFFGPIIASTSTEYNDLSWRGGVQYEFLPDAMLYGTVSRGYKGPAIGYSLSTNAAEIAATNGDIIKPEIVHAFEVGLKTQWFDRRLTANVAVYREIFDDFQTSVILDNAFGTVALTNAQQLISDGAEANLRWQISPSFSVSANEAFINARYTSFANAACYSGQTAAEGCVTTVTPGVGGAPPTTVTHQDATGRRLANSPREKAGLTGRFEHAITGYWSGYLSLNTTYQSNVNYSSLGDPSTVQGGYTLVNFSSGLNSSDGRWGVTVYGNNILDRHYVDLIVQNNLGDAILFNDIGYEDLRTFGVAFTAHF